MLKKSRVLSLIVSFSMIFTIMTSAVPSSAATSIHTSHSIATAASWAGNPLKGLIPFDGSTTTFPVSMEWFYIPLSTVMTGPTTFDWTALESHLNAISGRGHQACFRFYLDYPGMDTGVPQYLINGGLQMRYYDDSADLGGTGYCPNYEDANLRTAMKNFIAALGAKYDGDPRIGFITLGLLGFWGEWHTWPYDSDLSDSKPDWTPSTTVYTEVLTAYDSAFNKTPLLVREPKSGVPNASANIGYHDDSFGNATLSVAGGGQTWSFMQKVIDASEQNKWMNAPIGGEIYPPDQASIFASTPWQGSTGQTWSACLSETHATWLMCEQIKNYTGTTLTNAQAASKQLGYDFQVSNAYYDNLTNSSNLYIGIDLKNIGIAPFYYDHTKWPIKVGVKKNGTLVASWTTTWDLNTVPATGSKSFEFTTSSSSGLANGTYNMCLMVQNPLSNGNKLGFANSGQNSDGWLDLGTFTVGSSSDTQAPTVPSNLTSTGKTATSVSLSWSASTDNVGVTGYTIYRNGTSVGTTTSTSYTDTGLAAKTSYTYNVKAKDVAGNYSAASNSLSITTNSASTTTSYEAESSVNTLTGGAAIASVSGCSGGQEVGYVGDNSGTLQFNNVYAASAGSYTITVYYLSGENRNATVSVNGGTGSSVSFTSLGNWTSVGSKTISVNLNAGNNTIKFSNASGWAPDFDRITINS